MQGAYSACMEKERPVRAIRRARLNQLLVEFGGPKALQRLTGVTDTHITAASKGRRQIGDEMADSLEAGTGKPEGWMDSADTPDPRGAGMTVAQLMSHLTATLLPQLNWESIVGLKELPAKFITTVPDAAMRDHVQPGTPCIFRASSTSNVGDGILVIDSNDMLHLRLHAQGDRPGHFIAKADNQAFKTLDSEADGLRVVAVFEHALKGWGE